MSPKGPIEPQLTDLQDLVHALRSAVRQLEPRSFSDSEAMELVKVFAEGEALCAAGKTFAARRVERSGAWRAPGHRSAAHWMAAQTGVPVGQAVGTLETARRLEHLPATAMAFASGQLSEAKTKEVAAAAAVSPGQERELLEAARTSTVTSSASSAAGSRPPPPTSARRTSGSEGIGI